MKCVTQNQLLKLKQLDSSWPNGFLTVNLSSIFLVQIFTLK